MFIRGGSIIPEGPEMRFVGDKPFDPVTFYAHPDAEGRAATTLYEDDGTSPAYKQGVFRRTRVGVAPSGRGVEVSVQQPEGSYQPPARKLLFVVPFAATPTEVTLDGRRLQRGGEGGKSVGYHTGKGMVGVAIEDDGKPHKVVVR